MRRFHGVHHNLHVGRDATDREYLQALKDCMDPSAKLGELLDGECCDEPSRKRACALLPIALEWLEMPPKRPWKCPLWLKYSVTFVVVAVAGALVATALSLFLSSKGGLREGVCRITDFARADCTLNTTCSFHVKIAAEGIVHGAEPWMPQFTYSYNKGRMAWLDDPFRCCDDGLLQCCHLFDDASGGFCDNWKDRFDSDGRRCWSGPWPCLYRLHTVDGVWAVREVHYYAPPPTAWLLGLALALLVCLLVLWVADGRRSRSGRAGRARAASAPAAPRLGCGLERACRSGPLRRAVTEELAAGHSRQGSKASEASLRATEVATSTCVVVPPQARLSVPGLGAGSAAQDFAGSSRIFDHAVLEQQMRPIITPLGGTRRPQKSPVQSPVLSWQLAPAATNIWRQMGSVPHSQLNSTLN